MNTIRALAPHPDRLAQLLPVLVAALLFAGMAMQAKLLPVRPMRLEFPSDAGVAPGAAPEEAVAPPAASVTFTAPTPVLPRDSVPDAAAPAEPAASVATVAPSVEPALAGAAAGIAMSPALGLPGAGNLALRANRAHAVTALVASLMQTVERLRAAHAASRTLRRPAAIRTVPHSPRPPVPAGAVAKASPLPTGLGGSAPLTGLLGGPVPFGGKSAPVLNGSTMRRKF